MLLLVPLLTINFCTSTLLAKISVDAHTGRNFAVKTQISPGCSSTAASIDFRCCLIDVFVDTRFGGFTKIVQTLELYRFDAEYPWLITLLLATGRVYSSAAFGAEFTHQALTPPPPVPCWLSKAGSMPAHIEQTAATGRRVVQSREDQVAGHGLHP